MRKANKQTLFTNRAGFNAFGAAELAGAPIGDIFLASQLFIGNLGPPDSGS